MSNTLTDRFLLSLFSMKAEDSKMSKECLLDYLGVTLAGGKAYCDEIQQYLNNIEDSNNGASVICFGRKIEVSNAALVNGICAHAVELDDGHRIGMPHLEATIISALLAVAEKNSISSIDFCRGILVGYEAAIRLSCAIQPGHKLKGYHATGTCGTIGAAIGIAVAMHFDYEQMKSAFSAAVTSAAGLLEMIEGDSQMKPFNAGRAAMAGVTAAYIGMARFKAPEDALGGKRGFLRVMTDDPQMKYLTDFSDAKPMIEGIYRKPYAACRHCHPSIEAAMNIRLKDGFNINEVESVRVDTYKLAVSGHDHTEIKGVNSAKMSIPYSLAVALCTGKAGLDEFTDKFISNKDIQSITDKVSVSDVDELTVLCPQKRVAEVTVTTNNGIFTKRVDYPKGEPENPLSRQELEDKFRGLAMYGGLTSEECDEVINEIWKDDFDLLKILRIVNKATSLQVDETSMNVI